MNRKSGIYILVALIVVFSILPMAGCSQSALYEDDLEDDFANVDLEWPDYVPESLPEFTEGRIINASGEVIARQMNIKITLLEVTSNEIDDYIAKLVEMGYEQIDVVENKTGYVKRYGNGENALSLHHIYQEEDLTISFTGN
ncbi:MAG: hypothetical protein R3232_02420 [Clostridia bacterium]|nr:hypothetical protein [Clostridia bacterium]